MRVLRGASTACDYLVSKRIIGMYVPWRCDRSIVAAASLIVPKLFSMVVLFGRPDQLKMTTLK